MKKCTAWCILAIAINIYFADFLNSSLFFWISEKNLQLDMPPLFNGAGGVKSEEPERTNSLCERVSDKSDRAEWRVREPCRRSGCRGWLFQAIVGNLF